jgi:hypothetical protein
MFFPIPLEFKHVGTKSSLPLANATLIVSNALVYLFGGDWNCFRSAGDGGLSDGFPVGRLGRTCWAYSAAWPPCLCFPRESLGVRPWPASEVVNERLLNKIKEHDNGSLQTHFRHHLGQPQ